MSEKETISKIGNYFELNDNKNTSYQTSCMFAKAKNRKKCIVFKTS